MTDRDSRPEVLPVFHHGETPTSIAEEIRAIGLHHEPELQRFAQGGSGTRNMALHWWPVGTSPAEVRVCPGAHQEPAERVAAALSNLPRWCLALIRRARDLHAQTPNPLPRRIGVPIPVTARQTEAGAVWLLNRREQGWASFGYRYESWQEVAKYHPWLRPISVGVDETGPYLPMREFPPEVFDA